MTEYDTHLDIKYGPLERIDINDLAGAVTHLWWNQTLCRVNDSVVRLGVLHGEYHWHTHADEEEFFLVLEGRLIIDLRDGAIELGPHQATVIPRGVEHRPRAPERTVVVMMEGADVVPTGD
ncbi:MAG: cupin domain-containing protein [Candidatus Dormibacteraeota bacterium]|nr:cupin domain-containing protein [Candidatus Dormibacteraeota bacterium]